MFYFLEESQAEYYKLPVSVLWSFLKNKLWANSSGSLS